MENKFLNKKKKIALSIIYSSQERVKFISLEQFSKWFIFRIERIKFYFIFSIYLSKLLRNNFFLSSSLQFVKK